MANTGSGNHDRQAGAACGQNSDCISEFCEEGRRICMDMCTDDASCPAGLACENAFVMLPGDSPSYSRLCLPAPDPNVTMSDPYHRMAN